MMGVILMMMMGGDLDDDDGGDRDGEDAGDDLDQVVDCADGYDNEASLFAQTSSMVSSEMPG